MHYFYKNINVVNVKWWYEVTARRLSDSCWQFLSVLSVRSCEMWPVKKTSSPAVAERSRDALCLSVSKLASIVQFGECNLLLLVTWASDLLLHTNKFCFLFFSVFTDAWQSLCCKQTCTVTVIHYCTDNRQLWIAHCSSHQLIASYSPIISICTYPTCIWLHS